MVPSVSQDVHRDGTEPSRDASAPPPWHARSVPAVLADLQTGMDGLAAAEAAQRVSRYGLNRLPSPKGRSELVRFLAQFNNLFIYVLLAAALLAVLIGHRLDAAVVLAVVVVNALIGYVQEGRAEKALEAIRAMIDPNANVLRAGHRGIIAAEMIVPGDLVLLEPGDRVPADLRLVRARNLRMDEAALTGESVPVEKSVAPVAASAPLAERASMALFRHLRRGRHGCGRCGCNRRRQ